MIRSLLFLLLIYSSTLTANKLQHPTKSVDSYNNSKQELHDENLLQTFKSLKEHNFEKLCFHVRKGLLQRDEFYSLYLRIHSLTLATEGNFDLANQTFNFAIANTTVEIPYQADILINDFIQYTESKYSQPRIRLIRNKSPHLREEELTKEEEGSIMDVLWGTGEVIGAIFLSAGGYHRAGVSLGTKGCYDIGKGIMSIIRNSKTKDADKQQGTK